MNNLAIAPDIIIESSDKTCPICLKKRAIKTFMTNGDEYDTCNKCRGEKPTPVAKNFAKRLVAQVRGGGIAATHISEIDAGMVERFGGVGELCDLWHEQIMMAVLNSPGSVKALRAIKDVVDLIKYSTEHRDSAPDIACMSDEELSKEMLKIAMKALPPEMFANAKTN